MWKNRKKISVSFFFRWESISRFLRQQDVLKVTVQNIRSEVNWNFTESKLVFFALLVLVRLCQVWLCPRRKANLSNIFAVAQAHTRDYDLRIHAKEAKKKKYMKKMCDVSVICAKKKCNATLTLHLIIVELWASSAERWERKRKNFDSDCAVVVIFSVEISHLSPSSSVSHCTILFLLFLLFALSALISFKQFTIYAIRPRDEVQDHSAFTALLVCHSRNLGK